MSNNNSNGKPQPKEEEKKLPDIWEALEKSGIPVEHHVMKEYPLTGGSHYWIVENPASLSIVCASCPVKHGGIVDAREAAKTRVVDGVIYYENQPVSRKPDRIVN